MWYLWLLLALVAFFAVLLLRAAMFRPRKEPDVSPSDAPVDETRAVESLQAMVRFRTVSYTDKTQIDEAEFERFRAYLKTRYPAVHAHCALERIGRTGLLFRLPGRSQEKPSVLMSHYDVVPVDEARWEKPPFAGVIEDGVLWGRGTLDTKCTLCGVLEATEHLLRRAFQPENDLYLAFEGDEEIAGDAAPDTVALLKKRGIVPALVLDEGGAVVEHIFPGVTDPCALVGIAEKGILVANFSLEGAGGHASAPPPHTAVGILGKTAANIEAHPFPSRLVRPVAEMFDTLGRRSTFLYRIIFANLWCSLPLLDSVCKRSGGELNAMLRTTCAFTTMEGSSATNVLPSRASVGANLRLLSGETPETALAYLQSHVADERVAVTPGMAMAPSPVSQSSGEAWEKIRRAIRETWPGAVVSPYLMVAGSDARHYCAISDHVYRFSAMALSAAERATIHGDNERIPVEKIVDCAKFYLRLIRSL